MLGRAKLTRTRSAFTLIELLVVIAIIAILTSLTAAGIFKWVGAQRNTTTENRLRTISGVLQRQWSDVIHTAEKEDIPPSILSLAGNNPRRARVIWIKLRLKQEFPMTFAEAHEPFKGYDGTTILAANDLPGLTIYKSLPTSQAGDPFVESSTCLMVALSQSRGGVSLPADLLGSGASDFNGDGFKELLDGWSQPIAFFRFPSGNAELDASKPARSGTKEAKFRDPLDADGRLLVSSWNFWDGSAGTPAANVGYFEALCHRIHTGTDATTYKPQSRYMVPVLVSSGPDAKWGINSSYGSNFDMTVSGSDADDNLMSFRLQGVGG